MYELELERSEIVEERLQKYLANNGIAARRKCEEFILDGRVKVNGKVVKSANELKKDDEINIRFYDGNAKAKII